MIKNFLLSLVFLLMGLNLFAQEQNRCRLNFILFIDDKIPKSGINDAVFLMEDSTKILDSIPVKYKVGELKISNSDFKKLFSQNPDDQIFLKFRYRQFYPENIERVYKCNIPSTWINKEYIILKVYNSNIKVNRKMFVFDKKKYLVKVIVPSAETLLITKKH